MYLLKRVCISSLLVVIGLSTFSVAAKADYPNAKEAVEKQRAMFAAQYRDTQDLSARKAILGKASDVLHKALLKQLFPHWYGTDWDYYGTSQVPRQGKIACGYFVTTLLRDAGFNLERVKLAQQASERIIQSLVPERSIRRYRHVSLSKFVADIKQWGDGIYIVGLDNHVGFISVSDSKAVFIHSTFYGTCKVVSESADSSYVLGASKYRVLGKLDDAKLMVKWLAGEKIATVTAR